MASHSSKVVSNCRDHPGPNFAQCFYTKSLSLAKVILRLLFVVLAIPLAFAKYFRKPNLVRISKELDFPLASPLHILSRLNILSMSFNIAFVSIPYPVLLGRTIRLKEGSLTLQKNLQSLQLCRHSTLCCFRGKKASQVLQRTQSRDATAQLFSDRYLCLHVSHQQHSFKSTLTVAGRGVSFLSSWGLLHVINIVFLCIFCDLQQDVLRNSSSHATTIVVNMRNNG